MYTRVDDKFMALTVKSCVRADSTKKVDQDKAELDKADAVDLEPQTPLNETSEMAQDIYRKIREWYKEGEFYSEFAFAVARLVNRS